MLTITELVGVLLVVHAHFASSKMETNISLCSEGCRSYSFQLSHFSQVDSFEIQVELSDEIFLKKHLQSFPCPPAWLPHFCTDWIAYLTISLGLSCQNLTTILEVCLLQTQEKFYINLLSDCKKHLKCQKFKSLCSSKKYSSHCVDDYGTGVSVPPIIGDTTNEHMNNTTADVMTQAGADSGSYNNEPSTWNVHVLWALLVLVYIFIFVPCFLNFVIKRSIIDKLRNRWQNNRKKHLLENHEEDEPPLIPAIEKEVHTPVCEENSLFIPSRPDSIASTIGEDFDFPFADESRAVSMISLLIQEQR